MGIDKFMTIAANAFLGGQLPLIKGTWYFVDVNHPNCADGNPGTDINYPLETIEKALALCTADYQDGICVMDGSYTLTATFTLLNNMVLCGPPGARPETSPVTITSLGTNINAVTLSASDCRILGISFACADGYAPIYITGSRNEIAFCKFSGAGDYGVRIGGGTSNSVHDCYIQEPDLYGIRISSSGYNVIEGNWIVGRSAHVTKHGIAVNGNLATYNRIKDNYIFATDQKMSSGITISASATYNFLVDNKVQITTSAASNKHFRNVGGATNKQVGLMRGSLTLQMSASAVEPGPVTAWVTS